MSNTEYVRPRAGTCENCGVVIPARRRGPLPTVCPAHKAERKRQRQREKYQPRAKRAARPERRNHRAGERFGSLVLVQYVERDRHGWHALFACDCGNVKALALRNVVSGQTTNCADRAAHPDPRRGRYRTQGQPAYGTAHKLVEAARGRAREHECSVPDCTAQAFDWAYLHGSTTPLVQDNGTKDDGKVYADDPNLYEPMCRSHHHAWDRAHLRQTNGNPRGLSLAHVTAWEATR